MKREQTNEGVANGLPDKRLKILVCAYACEPNLSSEPGIGWDVVQKISQFHDIWALTASEHRPGIEAYLQNNALPNVHWVYPRMPSWMPSWKKNYKIIRFHYYLWQIMAHRTIRRDYADIPFDAIHHVTWVNYWTPSFLSRLPAPFIWGPVGGGESAPRSFYSTLKPKSRFSELVRDAVRWTASRVDPFIAMTARRARITFCTTEETAVQTRKLGAKDVRILQAMALSQEDIALLNGLPVRQETVPFRVISIGRLIGWKGFHLGLQAYAQFQRQNPDSEYWIVGDGDEMERLKSLAQELGISDKVRFTGKLPRSQALERLAEADVLLHPSLHDSGGGVCLEAMAAGRPVICLNLGGRAVQITKETGIVVPARTPDQAVSDLAKAMQHIAIDNALRLQMGEAGRRCIDELYNWDRKGEFYSSLYESLSSKSEKGLR